MSERGRSNNLIQRIVEGIARPVAYLRLAAKRLWHSPAALFLELGIFVAAALMSSAYLYSEGATEALLHQRLESRSVAGHTCIGFRFVSLPQSSTRSQAQASSDTAAAPVDGQTTDAGVAPSSASSDSAAVSDGVRRRDASDSARIAWTDAYLRTQAGRQLGLRPEVVAQVKTDPLDARVNAADGSWQLPAKFSQVLFLARSDADHNLSLHEGRYPAAADASSTEIEVLVSPRASELYELLVGDVYYVSVPSDVSVAPLAVRVVGIGEPTDESALSWFGLPALDDRPVTFVVPQETIENALLARSGAFAVDYIWYLFIDNKAITVHNQAQVAGRIQRLAAVVEGTAVGADMFYSPNLLFGSFAYDALLLRMLMLALSVPIIVIVMYYVLSAANMVMSRRTREISILRSRGASKSQVVAMMVSELVILGLLAVLVAPLAGMAIAQAMAHTDAFLSFVPRAALPLRLTPPVFVYSLAGALLGLVVAMAAVWSAARQSVVNREQEELGRVLRVPWWQRYYIDVLLLAISLYAYHQLGQQGSLFRWDAWEDAFIDPLQLLAPTFFIFAMTLITVRCLPWLYRLLSSTVGKLGNAVVCLGLQLLDRSARRHTAFVLLLILAVSLGTFVSTLGQVIDSNQDDVVYYGVGADLHLAEAGKWNEDEGRWVFNPFDRHLDVPGVRSAARLALTAGFQTRARPTSISVIGIDRLDYPQTAFWRSDFATQSLGALMNALAGASNAALINRDYAEQGGLVVGDAFSVDMMGQNLDLVVAGIIERFPGVTNSTYLCVANLDYLFARTASFPYDVLLKLEPDASVDGVLAGLEAEEFSIKSVADARSIVAEGRARRDRVGFLGILSVGFYVAVFLAVLGFLVEEILSFRSDVGEMGVLRALGMSANQAMATFFLQRVLTVVSGLAIGVGVGALASHLYVPFLHAAPLVKGTTLPYLITTPWTQIWWLVCSVGGAILVGLLGWTCAQGRYALHRALRYTAEF